MSGSYRQNVVSSVTRFTDAPLSNPEYSKMSSVATHYTTFNAGDIFPVFYFEILPHDSFSVALDFVIRQTTVRVPTMGRMNVGLYAYWVPNRVINESWKNVYGENTSGMWTAPDVDLVPLYSTRSGMKPVQVPVQSVADYYGFPTQAEIPAEILQQCNDLKFRGYLDIYNEHWRDENYQAPIPFSKLNVYEGFFEPLDSNISLDYANAGAVSIPNGQVADGSAPLGALQKAIYGDGAVNSSGSPSGAIIPRASSWNALQPPLKANKLKDYFTSVLPSPQKGPEVQFSLAGSAPVSFNTSSNLSLFQDQDTGILLNVASGSVTANQKLGLIFNGIDSTGKGSLLASEGVTVGAGSNAPVTGWNITGQADLTNVSAISVTDLRDGAAVQQVYEAFARGGTRYREFINSFFGLDVETPFYDCSIELGRIVRNLDLYQTAQTSSSVENGTPQGNLAAFGYTSNGGHLFTKTFVEHGYVHILACVRHRNVYSSFLARDNFRRNKLDFYLPQLANISEQPVYTREINPFIADGDSVFGYQEYAAEYRMDVDRVSGYMRPGISETLDLWNYADDFDSTLQICDGDWLKSNSAQVMDRTLAVSSEQGPQMKGMFTFTIVKERPMPTYSIPGMDII